MSTSFIDRLMAELERSGVASRASLRGCDARDIRAVEKDVGLALPGVYREFLTAMGRGAGRFFQGTDMFLPRLQGLNAAARELLKEDPKAPSLPEDAIVFSMHQGYQFMFVRAIEGDDPAVFYYMENKGVFTRIADSLSAYLLKSAEEPW